ncbi:MiaB/RimO family radical SAM methylthiotransferase [Novosphingobium sp. Gsoil 351]|uniref:MiaB/RimO family radical SAM methylthiotransferase n=1 Tax=Novosphingobium sp. Gsoil 351 TaxID=2675225 RepID=UPI0012B44B20|nr:radical SAM protein [Novosphingobium sp. Gsoil 351]QGN56049.1 radical SAM protein [Novosphingobium sp. Gsoil 351]
MADQASSVQVVTLGCRLNHAESARLAVALRERRGTVVVNTCAVTAQAVRQSRRAVRHARGQGLRVIATGCAATIDPKGFAALADEVLPNSAKPESALPASADRVHTRAFVPVQNGCDHACTFCIIPQGRGPSRSRPIAAVVDEIAVLAETGVGEVVLTGVDLTSYAAPNLGTLVAKILARVPALPRLRLSSLDGVEIDPLLFELIVGEPRVMPHVHLSLQSGDDLILKRMKRRHARSDAVRLVERLKTARPEIAIGADIIAGFPTESATAHASNLSLIEQCAIVHGHVFPYSPRPGTPAARMPQVDPVVVRERAAGLRAAVATRRERWLAGKVGTVEAVLAEQDGTGHAPDFARYRLPEAIPPGTVAMLRATSVGDGLLLGEAA